MGNLESVTDANGNTTTYKYDLLDRLNKEIRPDGGEINYEYDPAGNRTAMDDANTNRTTYGNITTFTYDALNGLKTVADPAPADGGVTTCTYDSRDSLTSVTDADGNVTTYDYGKKGSGLQ